MTFLKEETYLLKDVASFYHKKMIDKLKNRHFFIDSTHEIIHKDRNSSSFFIRNEVPLGSPVSHIHP